MNLENRIAYLDWLRILAMLMIISIHSPMPNIGTNGLVLSSISFLMAPGIGLFFMVSGALLLPTNDNMKPFLKHRLGKVVWPTVIWSLFYLSISWLKHGTSPYEIAKSLLSIPLTAQGNGILWFMYTLIGLYILTPIISPWLQKASQKEVVFILALWGITMSYPLIDGILHINDTKTGVLYYESGYAGYFLLGYYLRKYHHHNPFKIIALLILIPITIAAWVKTKHIPVDFYSAFWYLSILTAMMSAGWFLFFKRLFKSFSPKLLATISNCCFGVYFIHIFVMRQIIWKWDLISQFGGIIQILLTVVLTASISFVIVYAISYLPISYYLIGFRQKQKTS